MEPATLMDGDNKRPLEKEEMTLLRWLTGKINWAASQTKQDLSYSVLELSTKFKSGKLHGLKMANKAINRLIPERARPDLIRAWPHHHDGRKRRKGGATGMDQ